MTAVQPFCWDVAIIGGGIVGLTTALALAKRSSLRVLVLESHPTKICWEPDVADVRVSAITPASQRIFSDLGCWEYISACGVSPFCSMFVWNERGSGSVMFSAQDFRVPVLGHIIANRLLTAGLTDALENHPAVEVQYGVKPSALLFHSDRVCIQTASDGDFYARLVVGADGAHSITREMAGFRQSICEYGQKALVAQVETTLPHAETARQRFLTEGPLAFLPLSSPHQCSIVWSIKSAEADRLQSLSDEDFSAVLDAAFENCLGQITHVTARAAFPLIRRHAEKYVRDRFALVGDAAHTIHPLAGQGVNMGISDAVTLAETVVAAANKRRSFAAIHTLRRYERARKTDNLMMMWVVDFFQKFSMHRSQEVQSLWNVGMKGVDQFYYVKKYLAEYAFGGR